MNSIQSKGRDLKKKKKRKIRPAGLNSVTVASKGRMNLWRLENQLQTESLGQVGTIRILLALLSI